MIDSVITPDIPEEKFLRLLRNQSPETPEIKSPDIPEENLLRLLRFYIKISQIAG